MKALLFSLLLSQYAIAGEIMETYFKLSKERTDAEMKLRDEELKRIEKETNIQKRIERLEMLTKSANRLEIPSTSLGFQFFTNNGTTEIGHGNIVTNHGISEIGFERTGCYGTCPSYTFIITSGGKCRYEGGKHAKIEGKKTGRVSIIEFHRLAEFLLSIQFFALKDEYTASLTDSSSTFTTATLNGKRKIIDNYAGLGPAQLWAVEQILDGMVTRARWDK